MVSVWELIKSGEYDRACRAADEEFRSTSSVFPLRNKVFALLLLNRFADAAELCREIIRSQQGDTDSDFIFLGTSLWLLGDRNQAISAWQSSSETRFTDAAGGVEVALLLLYAAIRVGDSSLRHDAENQLVERCTQPEIGNWPGPIANFVLGRLAEAELLSAINANHPILKAKQLCQAEFYLGLQRLAAGDSAGFLERMGQAKSQGAVSPVKQEFYLADGELRSASHP
jgi:hypothetical protein